LAPAFEGVLDPLGIGVAEQLPYAGEQIRGRLSSERVEGFHVPLHRAVLLFFEEGHAELVSYPTD
jgi:hypothetical protein